MKHITHVRAGATAVMINHDCAGLMRLNRLTLTRGERAALERGRPVYRLETCSFCTTRRCCTLLSAAAPGRFSQAQHSGD